LGALLKSAVRWLIGSRFIKGYQFFGCGGY
jgi:hypothetical protein